MPRIWVGFCFAGLTLLVTVFADPHSVNFTLLPPLITLAGWFYWLFCVFKYHDVMSSIQGYNHPISASRAVAMHWIPLYSIYWVFKWPKEIATFVNWRMQSPQAMNGIIPGILVLVGVILYRYSAFLSLTILFSSGIYLSHRIKAACLAPPVPRAMHASASAGPLGLG
jgi:hypothetical protein